VKLSQGGNTSGEGPKNLFWGDSDNPVTGPPGREFNGARAEGNAKKRKPASALVVQKHRLGGQRPWDVLFDLPQVEKSRPKCRYGLVVLIGGSAEYRAGTVVHYEEDGASVCSRRGGEGCGALGGKGWVDRGESGRGRKTVGWKLGYTARGAFNAGKSRQEKKTR